MPDMPNQPLEVQEHIKSLNERRIRAMEEGKRVADEAAARPEGQRGFSAEERQKLDRIDADIAAIESERNTYVEQEKRTREAEAMRAETLSSFGEKRVERVALGEAAQLRAFLLGDTSQPMVSPGGFEGEPVRSVMSIPVHKAAQERQYLRQGMDLTEARALAWDTGNVASTVPVTTARSLYQVLEASIAAFRMPTYRLAMNSGEQIKLPKITTHGLATQVKAQGTTLAGTDTSFDQTTLDAYKYGQLVKIANEVVTDSGIDIVSVVTGEIGYALGRVIDADIIVGTGSSEPQGIISGITGSGTIATGGSLIDPSYEKLIDLVYSVNDSYRSGGNAGFLMRDATAGVLRKLRDGAGGTVGAVLWDPSLTSGIQNGQPDRLLGFPVYTDPNVASLASNAVVMWFGDANTYVFRTVGNVMIESDASRYFDTDELGVRGKWRVDGDYRDTTGSNIMKRSV